MHYTKWIIDTGFALSLLVNALLFIPQIIVILRRKSAENVSFTTFFGFCIIQLFTTFHGLITNDYLLAFGTALSIITCGAVTVLIIYFNYHNKKI